MANHVYNDLHIEGPEEDIVVFLGFSVGEKDCYGEDSILCANKFMNQHEMDNDGRDIYYTEITERREGVVCFNFFTQWQPCLTVVKKMGEMFPKLKFDLEYEDEGRAFKGRFVMAEGIVTIDTHGPYYQNEEQMK